MKSKKIYITFWYTSILCLIVALFFFALCFFRNWAFSVSIPLIVFTLLFLVLYISCQKPLACEDGYNIIQAISFYHACERAGCRGSNSPEDIQILSEIAEKEDFFKEQNNNKTTWLKCYKTGQSAAYVVTNPCILLFWKLQKKVKK